MSNTSSFAGIDGDIAEFEVLDDGFGHAAGADGAAGVGDLDVGDGDILDEGVAAFGGLDRGEHGFPVGRYGLDVVPFGQGGVAVAGIPAHGHFDDGAHAVHGQIADVNVLNRTATGLGGFKADTYARAFGGEVVGEQVSDTPGGFAAAGDQAAAFARDAVADDNVFAGPVDTQAVPIASGLEAEVVVVAVDVTVFDQHVAGRVDVHAVGAGAVAIDVVADDQTVDRDMLGVEHVDGPEAGLFEGQALEGDILTARDQHGTGAFAVVVYDPTQALGFVFVLAHGPVLVPEGFALGVDSAVAGDGGVVLVNDVEQSGGPDHFDTGHACGDVGVVFEVLTAQ